MHTLMYTNILQVQSQANKRDLQGSFQPLKPEQPRRPWGFESSWSRSWEKVGHFRVCGTGVARIPVRLLQRNTLSLVCVSAVCGCYDQLLSGFDQ